MIPRELSDAEREAMRDARDALYPRPLRPSHFDTIDVARRDAFEEGYRAALAARDGQEHYATSDTTCSCGGSWTFPDDLRCHLRGIELAAREAGKLPGDSQRPVLPPTSAPGHESILHDAHHEAATVSGLLRCRRDDARLVALGDRLSALCARIRESAKWELVRDTELPGDAQRVAEEMAERMAVIEKLAGFLADPSDDRECDCHGEGIDHEGAEWTLCECVLRRIGDLPDELHEHVAERRGAATACVRCGEMPDHPIHAGLVRDTEREHEPAKDNPSVADRAINNWRQIARVEEERNAAEQHAEVLAKALDRFFCDLRYTAPECTGERLDQLGARITPTMQALGYPKEKTP